MKSCIELNCTACCQGVGDGVQLVLKKKEVSFLRESGSQIVIDGNCDPSIDRDASVNYNGNYQATMHGKCGNLQPDGKCLKYYDPNRPKICKTTKVGSEGCTSCRQIHNLPPITK